MQAGEQRAHDRKRAVAQPAKSSKGDKDTNDKTKEEPKRRKRRVNPHAAGYKNNKQKDLNGTYVELWHNRMGHPGDTAAIKMIKGGLGVMHDLTVTLDDYRNSEFWCEICGLTKVRNRNHPARASASTGWPDYPNEIHSLDSTGKERTRTIWNDKYATYVTDHHDGRTWAYAHSSKKQLPEVLSDHEHNAVVDARLSRAYEDAGHAREFEVKNYWTDNAGELTSDREKARRKANRIGTTTTVPNEGHGPQNAVSERRIQSVRRVSNQLIHSPSCAIPLKWAKRMWNYADIHATHIMMMWPTAHNDKGQCTADKRYAEGKGARNANWRCRLMHSWGCEVITPLPGEKRKPRGKRLYFVGVPENFGRGYLLWDLANPNNRPLVYDSVVFQENPLQNSAESRRPAQKPTNASGGGKQTTSEASDNDETKATNDANMGKCDLEWTPIKEPKCDLEWTPMKEPESRDTIQWTTINDSTPSHEWTPIEGNTDNSQSEEDAALPLPEIEGEDDGWRGRLLIPKPGDDGKHLTVRKLWKMMVNDWGMEDIPLSWFRRMNCNPETGEAAGQHSRPPRVTEDGQRGWLWIPTEFGDIDGDYPPEQNTTSSDDEGAGESNPGDSAQWEHESKAEANMATSVADHNAAVFNTVVAHNRRRLDELREDHHNDKWYKAINRKVASGKSFAAVESTGACINAACALLGQTYRLAAKSARLQQSAKRPRHRRRARTCFEMANCLLLIATAQSVAGLEGMKARDIPEPPNYKAALRGEFASFWRSAIMKEFDNLEEHDIWELVELPAGRRSIDTTWRFKAKPNAAGLIDKFKARLCARGFRQMFGIDFTETHAPVTVISAWRANVAEMARYDWDFDIWDVKGAYLNSELLEEIYVTPPEGYPYPDGAQPGLVLRLKRALYGLKQAGRAWSKKFARFLKKKGFVASTADPSLFIKTRVIDGKEETIRLNVYVDDIFAVYSNEKWYNEFKAEVMDLEDGGFKLSASDDSNVFLGVSIDRLHDGAVKIHQRRYIEDLAARFLQDTPDKKAKVPYFTSIPLTKAMSPETEELKKQMESMPYRSLIGGLNHLANYTRPDIACAVNMCAQFSANPGMGHWKAAKQILVYLRSTADYGVIYGRSNTKYIPFVPICGYTDASWADDPDERKSRTGTMLWSWGGPIEWRSVKQKSIALSTTEAEYMAACEGVKSTIWARRLYTEFGYGDLGIPDDDGIPTEQELEGYKPVVQFQDNSGCIEWSKNPVQHNRAKHIDLRYHFIRAKVKSGEVKLVHCPTEIMMADLLTKYLAAPRFAFLRNLMMSIK